MNVDELVDDIIINKTKILSYDERINIIKDILEKHSVIIENNESDITAIGLQTLNDHDLIFILKDAYFLYTLKFFTNASQNKNLDSNMLEPNKTTSFFSFLFKKK